jgi:hypothetical protein
MAGIFSGIDAFSIIGKHDYFGINEGFVMISS